jgi:uncharacterized protein
LSEIIIIAALAFLVALIYSSVGHGGASGYLAVLSFFAVPRDQMASGALCLNLLVAGLAFYSFYKTGYFSWKLTWPFVLTSIPAAFLGGLVKIPPALYDGLLAAALIFAGIRLILNVENKTESIYRLPPLWVLLPIGGAIGFLSGIVGVGGGIFLSPLLILFRWANPKQTAAASAFFIFVNSASGLWGRCLRGGFQMPSDMLVLLFAAFLGGLAGSTIGARRFSNLWLKRTLAVVLWVAVVKLIKH